MKQAKIIHLEKQDIIVITIEAIQKEMVFKTFVEYLLSEYAIKLRKQNKIVTHEQISQKNHHSPT